MAPSKARVPLTPLLLVGTGILFIIGSIILLMKSPQETPKTALEMPAPVSSPRIPYPDIPRIRLGDAKAAYDLNQALFIDIRGEPYFSSGHIPGALSISEEEIDSRMGELNPEAWIIPYCT